MFFLQNRFCVRLHSSGQRQHEKRFSIRRICFLAIPGEFAGASYSIAKMAHPLRVRATLNPVQEFLFVQEKIAGQYALAGQLLKEIAGGDGHLTKRLLRIAGFPICETFACFRELLLVKEIESGADLRHGCEGRVGYVWAFARETAYWAQHHYNPGQIIATDHLYM